MCAIRTLPCSIRSELCGSRKAARTLRTGVVNLPGGPLEGVQIDAGQLGLGDSERGAEGGADLPLAVFVVLDEAQGQAERTLRAEQDSYGRGLQGEQLQDLFHRQAEHDVDDRK